MTPAALSRDDLLAVAPASMLDAILGAAPGERGTAQLALVEQLRAAGISPDALELTIVGWSGALDGAAPGPLPAERLARIDRTVAIESAGQPALAAWLTALRSRLVRAEDLDQVLQFLLAARQSWALTDALRSRQS